MPLIASIPSFASERTGTACGARLKPLLELLVVPWRRLLRPQAHECRDSGEPGVTSASLRHRVVRVKLDVRWLTGNEDAPGRAGCRSGPNGTRLRADANEKQLPTDRAIGLHSADRDRTT